VSSALHLVRYAISLTKLRVSYMLLVYMSRAYPFGLGEGCSKRDNRWVYLMKFSDREVKGEGHVDDRPGCYRHPRHASVYTSVRCGTKALEGE
jgi:hypothetical protein